MILDLDAYFVLVERHFDLRGDELRRSIDDQYKARFAQALAAMTLHFAGNDDPLAKAQSLEEGMRKKWTRRALDVLCRKGQLVDLRRVRTTLLSGFIDYSCRRCRIFSKGR
jgi:hypothetical protein